MGRAFEVRKVAMAKTAAVKSKVYAKYGREIYMAAKSGTPDPELNQTLKRIIEKAKKDQVSADVIKRAIEKAKGGSEENYVAIRYEGFGPGNSLIIVECLSDNVNRTVAEVRNCFTKTGGKLGISGSVIHQFEQKAVISTKDFSEEEVMEILFSASVNISDVEKEDNKVVIYGEASEYYNIRSAMQAVKNDIEFIDDEITWLPLNIVEINDIEEQEKFERIIGMLNELDDVQEIYHNAKY